MDRKNYYILLGLEPSVSDSRVIVAQIDEYEKKLKSLVERLNKPEHKQMLELVSDIRACMLDPERRSAEAKAAGMAFLLDPAKLESARKALPNNYAKIKDALEQFKYSDIYDFLSRSAESGNRTGRYNTDDDDDALIERAKELMEDYRNLAGSADKMQTASLVADFFKGGHKEAYDAYILLDAKNLLRSKLDTIIEYGGELDSDTSAKLTSNFARMYFKPKDVQTFISEYCEYKGYSIKSITQSQSASNQQEDSNQLIPQNQERVMPQASEMNPESHSLTSPIPSGESKSAKPGNTLRIFAGFTLCAVTTVFIIFILNGGFSGGSTAIDMSNPATTYSGYDYFEIADTDIDNNVVEYLDRFYFGFTLRETGAYQAFLHQIYDRTSDYYNMDFEAIENNIIKYYGNRMYELESRITEIGAEAVAAEAGLQYENGYFSCDGHGGSFYQFTLVSIIENNNDSLVADVKYIIMSESGYGGCGRGIATFMKSNQNEYGLILKAFDDEWYLDYSDTLEYTLSSDYDAGNLRDEPSLHSDVLTTVYQGDVLSFLNEEEYEAESGVTWYRAYHWPSGEVGWISNKLLIATYNPFVDYNSDNANDGRVYDRVYNNGEIVSESPLADSNSNYDEITLTGIMRAIRFQHSNGNWIDTYILELDTPANITADGETFNNVTEIQLIFKYTDYSAGAYEGKYVEITGIPMLGFNANYIRDVVLYDSSLVLLSTSNSWQDAYADFLRSQSALFAIRDLDGNGIPELILGHGLVCTFYSYDGDIHKLGKYDYTTGTTQLFISDNSSFPGIFNTWHTGGLTGPRNGYGYLEVKDGVLTDMETLFYENYATGEIIEEISSNKELISEARKTLTAFEEYEINEVNIKQMVYGWQD